LVRCKLLRWTLFDVWWLTAEPNVNTVHVLRQALQYLWVDAVIGCRSFHRHCRVPAWVQCAHTLQLTCEPRCRPSSAAFRNSWLLFISNLEKIKKLHLFLLWKTSLCWHFQSFLVFVMHSIFTCDTVTYLFAKSVALLWLWFCHVPCVSATATNTTFYCS